MGSTREDQDEQRLLGKLEGKGLYPKEANTSMSKRKWAVLHWLANHKMEWLQKRLLRRWAENLV